VNNDIRKLQFQPPSALQANGLLIAFKEII